MLLWWEFAPEKSLCLLAAVTGKKAVAPRCLFLSTSVECRKAEWREPRMFPPRRAAEVCCRTSFRHSHFREAIVHFQRCDAPNPFARAVGLSKSVNGTV